MSEATIHILPDHVANQIAAGEVVQRPDSVVKELVENALDAGATSVSVFVREGGKKSIRIIDNGSGILREDLPFVLLRHATSKISTSQDLYALQSLGFRGEAMASIASVADVEIRTCREGESVGWKLRSKPGEEANIEPVKADKGTEIVVKNLFYSVPARKKFLKSNLTEMKHIVERVKSIAMCNEDKRFLLYDNDKLVFDLQPTSIEERLGEIVGSECILASKPVQRATAAMSISGWIGLPETASKRRQQHLFLNGRSIQHKGLSHAVFAAMEHILDSGTYPFFVLFLQVKPDVVDVNVHPQKHEVKFENEREVYNLVYYATGDAIRSAGISTSHSEFNPSAPFVQIESDGKPSLLNTATGEILPRKPLSFSPPRVQHDNRSYSTNRPPQEQAPPMPPTSEITSALFETPTKREVTSYYLRASAQVIVEVHAGGFRVLHAQKAPRQLLANKVLMLDALQQQQLLFPHELQLPQDVSEVVDHEEVKSAGFVIVPSGNGNNKFLVSAIPEFLGGFDEQILRGLLAELTHELAEQGSVEGLGRKALQKAIVRSQLRIEVSDSQQIQGIFADFDTQNSRNMPVPHIIEVPWNEFESRFG